MFMKGKKRKQTFDDTFLEVEFLICANQSKGTKSLV